METNDTLQVDVDKVLADKNPGLARLLPRFVKAYLKRIVHQDEVNYVLRSFSHQPPVGFVRSTLDYMEITHRAVGLERLSLDGRYLFASNHPFGGMDGMMLCDELDNYFGSSRIIVNDILMNLKPLAPGGRLAVITYHSLEDRLVKNFMRSGNFGGKVEKDFYGRVQTPFEVVTRKAVVPTPEEIERNPRSRSAKLRIAELSGPLRQES